MAVLTAIVFIMSMAFRILLSQDLLGDQYIGCFFDSSNHSDVSISSILTGKNYCVEHCRINATNTTYAAVENGNKCSCREDYGIEVTDDNCNFTCTRKGIKSCDGTIRYQNSYALFSVCPIGRHGSTCQKACRCKSNVPCDRITGMCPDGCFGNWTGPTCNSNTEKSQLSPLRYVGCYEEMPDARSLGDCASCDGKGKDNKNTTLESCVTECLQRNYTFAGTQEGWQCRCGDRYEKKKPNKNEAKCILPCSSDTTQICGGNNFSSIYSVCPPGFFGNFCSLRCNCERHDSMCQRKNGSCLPSSRKCKVGWTGIGCNMRDCEKSNGDCDVNQTCYMIDLIQASVNACRCSEGFRRMKLWTNCEDQRESFFFAIIAATTGVAAFVLVVSLIAITLCAILKCRRRRKYLGSISGTIEDKAQPEVTNKIIACSTADTVLIE